MFTLRYLPQTLQCCRYPLRALSTTITTTTPSSPPSNNTHPLKDLRVLDLTRIVAGPYCTMILADLGADVIKVERPHVGDESRRWGPPFLANSSDSAYFASVNRNKRSICVDIKRGADVIADLAAQCDVLVENYVPGKLTEYGLGYEQLSAQCPRLVYCSITGYGSEGPYAQRPGYDVMAASLGGLLHITGEPDGEPAKVGVAVTDLATGLYAHGAILAALLQRSQTGRGQKIDVNLLSTQVASLINVGSSYLNAGQEGQRWGTAHPNIVPQQCFHTSSGYLTLGTGSDEQFRALCSRLERPDLAADPRFVSNRLRIENRVEIIAILGDIFREHSTDYWLEKFAGATFPVAPVNTIAEVFADPHVQEIGLVQQLEHPVAGSVRVVGPPVRYSEAANTARSAPPVLGQHTEEVLRAVLGYDADRIGTLRDQKIVQ